jgi:hypothetical protein
MRNALLSLILFSSTLIYAGQDPLITRGPYLQAGTETTMVVRWRSSNQSISTVKWGTSYNQQTNSVTDSAATGEHELKITGLQPFTKYYYSVYEGATQLAGDDTTYNFITNPVQGTVQPIHMWVIGDMGKANTSQMRVRDTYWNNIRNNRHTDVWLWLGDNVYTTGTDQEYQTELFAIYPNQLRNVVSRPAPGNHDYGSVNFSTNDGPYFQNFTMTREGEAGGVPSHEEGYYSYNYGNIHFVSLNSEKLSWFTDSSSAMGTWLKADLAANTQPFVIAYWHQPPYTRGSHNSDDLFGAMYFMRNNYNRILERYGVDLVLCGHSHNFERSYLLKGHYGDAASFDPFTMAVSTTSGKTSLNEAYTKYTTGPNANQGTVYVVCGNGGSTSGGNSMDHPVMYYGQQDSAGFMTIDVNGMQLDAKYYDASGHMNDNFTIIKSTTNPNGIESIERHLNDLKIYPNPFDKEFKIEFSTTGPHELQIEMLDVNGKLIGSYFNGETKAGINSLTIQTKNLQAGNYVVRFKGGNFGEMTRLVTLQK